MALTLTQLQDYINTNVKKNGRNAITGDQMNYLMLNFVDWVNSNTALPDKATNALKFLRVTAAETGWEWAAVQEPLVSGTNIKTINGTSLLGPGDVTISSSNIGNNDLTISAAGTRKLTMYGSSSTDLWAIRNSGNTFNIVETRGDGTIIQLVNSTSITAKIGNNLGGTNTDLWYNVKTSMSSGTSKTGFHAEASGKVLFFTEYGSSAGGGSGSGHVWHDPIASNAWFYFGEDLTNGLGMRFGAISAGSFQPTGAWMQISKFGGTWAQSVVSIGTFLGATTTTLPATNLGGNTFRILTGTAPTASYADTFCLYSADIVAGNAAPHFRTENNDIVKIYSIGGWGTPTGTLTRTTFDESTVTLPELAQRVAAMITDLKTGHQLFKA